jgi:hypothetical protein
VQLGRIRQAIAEALESAAPQGEHDRDNLAVSIRIWVPGAYTPDRSRSGLDALQGDPQEHRGWGFFLVRRNGDGSQASDVESQRAIELYLYHEGGLQKSRQT